MYVLHFSIATLFSGPQVIYLYMFPAISFRILSGWTCWFKIFMHTTAYRTWCGLQHIHLKAWCLAHYKMLFCSTWFKELLKPSCQLVWPFSTDIFHLSTQNTYTFCVNSRDSCPTYTKTWWWQCDSKSLMSPCHHWRKHKWIHTRKFVPQRS